MPNGTDRGTALSVSLTARPCGKKWTGRHVLPAAGTRVRSQSRALRGRMNWVSWFETQLSTDCLFPAPLTLSVLRRRDHPEEGEHRGYLLDRRSASAEV